MTSKEDRQYKLMELLEKDLSRDPFEQFGAWYMEVSNSDFPFPNSFILSTSDNDGIISSRVLLLKEFNKKGFKFYTNKNSRKGKELIINNNASICFWWDRLERQVRIEGLVSGLSKKESENYFNTRPRGSQLGAWASDQSSIISDRTILEDNYLKYEKLYQNKKIPKPDFWKGYILTPSSFEFWQGRDNRLHDRFLYTVRDNVWVISRLAP
jgi:pyridoxamine 5'-phosphate oxidase